MRPSSIVFLNDFCIRYIQSEIIKVSSPTAPVSVMGLMMEILGQEVGRDTIIPVFIVIPMTTLDGIPFGTITLLLVQKVSLMAII